MNNYKMDYAKKFHYIIKYLLLSIPLILIIYELILRLILISDVDFSISSSTTSGSILSQIVEFNFIQQQDFSLFTQNFVDFCTTGINGWYYNFLNAFGFTSNIDPYFFMSVLLCVPIWVLNVYVFDIVLDFLLLLPKLAHRLMDKLGGERYD